MKFPCIKCKIHKYTTTQRHKYKLQKIPNMGVKGVLAKGAHVVILISSIITISIILNKNNSIGKQSFGTWTKLMKWENPQRYPWQNPSYRQWLNCMAKPMTWEIQLGHYGKIHGIKIVVLNIGWQFHQDSLILLN